MNMKMVYEQFSGRNFNEPPPKQGKGHVKAIHYIQSFDPKDNISPETAFKIGKLFITKAFGKNAQVVLATHLDKGHLHNHIIINSYGIDGKKFYANKETLNKIKEISDRASLTYGVQPYDKSKAKRSTIAYNEWQNEQRGKYISVKAPDQKRSVRLQTLGSDYTAESLSSRILWRDVGSGTINPCANSTLRNSYNSVINEGENNGADVYKLSALLSIINRDNLQSIGEVEGKINQLKYELEKARQEVNLMETKCNLLKSLAVQAEEYFALTEKSQFTSEEQLRMEMYRETLAKQNIESTSDYEYLKGVIIETEQKAAPVREHYNRCATLLKEYSDISATYNEITQGDYISKLIEQQRKQDVPQTRPRR